MLKMDALCFNCFRSKPVEGACPYCGYDHTGKEEKFPLALKPGTRLANRFSLGRVLGQGGFGITYIALDSSTQSRVAIKEYLPIELALRVQNTQALQVYSENAQENFAYGKQQFLDEAKTLAQFYGNEHIISILSYFEENSTAYFAMEYMEGVNLKQYMEQLGRPLEVYEANRILLPVMESLEWVHSKGIIHRDISPDNIMIRRDGTAKLIDFGSARYSTGEVSRSLDVILKHGFAPVEQYTRRGRQGPYTDVYAMAATYYYSITGKVPPDAIERTMDDKLILPSSLGIKIHKSTEESLIKGLAVTSADRWQTMREFYSAMIQSMPTPFDPEEKSGRTIGQKQENRRHDTRKKPDAEKKPRTDSVNDRQLSVSKSHINAQAASEKQAKGKKQAAILIAAAVVFIVISVAFVFILSRTNIEAPLVQGGNTSVAATSMSPDSTEKADKPESSQEDAASTLSFVSDLAGLLSEQQRLNLETEACRIAEMYSCGVYVSTLEDYGQYPGITESSFLRFSESYYKLNDLGIGSARNGLLLILSMADSDYSLIAYGDRANFAFTDYGKSVMESRFLPYLSSGDWYSAFSAYINESENQLKAAESGYPIDIDASQDSADPHQEDDGSPLQDGLNDLSNAEVGDYVTFGTYEQDNNMENGKEDIEWLVLAKENNRLLVASRYLLDVQPYNTERLDVSWETCTLRKWLNEDFLNNAFNEKEQALIPVSIVSGDKKTEDNTELGNDTEDQVFLLSVSEVNECFSSDVERACALTDYAAAMIPKGIASDYEIDGRSTTWWWLRSSGSSDDSAPTVDDFGGASNPAAHVSTEAVVNVSYIAVRPALWVSFETDVSQETKYDCEVGDTLLFGHYEQDNNIANGKEEIEWQVLEKEENRILVISKYGLDARPYNAEFADITWETSSLRKWLNVNFLNSAFNEEEQTMIPIVTVIANTNTKYDTDQGNDTEDQVFLLSIQEVNKYFNTDEARRCATTDYAVAQGADIGNSYKIDGRDTCLWWLRTTGHSSTSAVVVRDIGVIDRDGHLINYTNDTVRPALWINLDS